MRAPAYTSRKMRSVRRRVPVVWEARLFSAAAFVSVAVGLGVSEQAVRARSAAVAIPAIKICLSIMAVFILGSLRSVQGAGVPHKSRNALRVLQLDMTSFAGPAFGSLATAEPQHTETRVQELLGQLTLDEKIAMLSGDMPFWQGFADILSGGYPRHPWVAARHSTPRHSRNPLHRRPARPHFQRRHYISRQYGAGRGIRSGVGRARWRCHRAGTARVGRESVRRRMHQPAAPSGLGPRAGNLRRG